MTDRMSHNPEITDEGIGQIRSEQCSFSLAAASCPAMENSGRRNISFDPMPGQGVELLAGFKGSALEQSAWRKRRRRFPCDPLLLVITGAQSRRR